MEVICRHVTLAFHIQMFVMESDYIVVLIPHQTKTKIKTHLPSYLHSQPRDLWSAGRREKVGKEKAAAAEEEDMLGAGEEEDDDGGEEDPAVAMTVRMDRRAVRRARRASAPAVTTSTPTTTFKPAPSQWSVEEVTAFIHTLPGKL